MNDDVAVVEQDPVVLLLTLTTQGLGTQLEQGLLDRIDHGGHLPIIGGGAHHEDIGDNDMLTHVDGDDVLGKLLRGRQGSRDRELYRFRACRHVSPFPCFRACSLSHLGCETLICSQSHEHIDGRVSTGLHGPLGQAQGGRDSESKIT